MKTALALAAALLMTATAAAADGEPTLADSALDLRCTPASEPVCSAYYHVCRDILHRCLVHI